VCIPGLHLSLGIYNRLWSLLIGACTELDIKLALLISGEDSPSGSSTYNHFSTLLRKKSILQMELETQQNYVSVVDEMVTYSSLTLPDAETNSFLGQLHKSATDGRKTLQKMVYM
jgi:hypothetical protein